MPGTLVQKTVLNALFASGASLWSPHCGLGAILMFHRVNAHPPRRGFAPNAHLVVTPRFLDRLVASLKRHYDLVSMDEAAQRIREPDRSRDGRRFIAITLDDGYRDNLVNAVPVFERHGVPYTIFIAPGLVEGEATLWWEDLEVVIASRERIVMHSPANRIEFDLTSPAKKRAAYSELVAFLTSKVDEQTQRRMVAELAWQAGVDIKAHVGEAIMNWREIEQLSARPLCTIGAHTVNHYAVARLDRSLARAEIIESARIIEMETGRRPRHFAFPYGYRAAAGPRDFELARECGFETAVTTRLGVLHAEHAEHMHALPRVSVNGHFQGVRHVETLLSGLPAWFANRGKPLNVA
ncbi:MAG: polysaccharide deacetylase family protein [Nitratireductor sp.]|jgi:peptidoglycan/xylan/chitin deacetylase (PgdA/CDA1 family)|nr:polysaccharide deacetylase family protein [Nitratireductor sp.]